MSLQKAAEALKKFVSIVDQRGFTMHEVLFSVFMIVTVLLALAGMTTTLIHQNSMNDFTDTAVDLAQDKIEELKNALSTSATLVDANTSNNSDLESTSNFDYRETNINGLGQAGGIYTRTWNIADNNPKSGMKAVAVIVTWNDRTGSHRVSFRTIL